MSKTVGERPIKIGICLDCNLFRYWPVDDPAPRSCSRCDGPILDVDCVRSTWAPESYDHGQIREFYLRLWEAGMSEPWPGHHERIALPGDDHRGD